MRKKSICIVLALLMCMMVTLPAHADNEAKAQERAQITASYGLTHISGSQYKMWAIIKNPNSVNVTVTLALYDASYNYITSVSTTSTNTTIPLSKYVTLSSGTYHLRLSFAADGATHSSEKTYTV